MAFWSLFKAVKIQHFVPFQSGLGVEARAWYQLAAQLNSCIFGAL